MKKMSKTLGAVAASAALAIGCAMPAFATAPQVGMGGNDTATGTGDTSASGSTIVNLYGYEAASQIVAEIPVDLTVSAPKDGGALICPSPSSYKITNKSTALSITISSVKATPAAGWDIVSKDVSKTNAGVNVDTNAATSNAQINLKLGPAVSDFGATQQYNSITAAGGALALLANVEIAANGGEQALALAGSAVPKTAAANDNFPTDASQQAAQITYTISKVVSGS